MKEQIEYTYSLENHLERLTSFNSDYDILLSSWKLNKRSLPLALSNVSQTFPHYSMHEGSHSKTIIRNIEFLLGEERIKTLGATETWLILMSAYTHDLGMVVFYKNLSSEWSSPDFEEYLSRSKKNKFDLDLADAATQILSFRDLNEKSVKINILNEILLPLKFRKSVILLAADYFRRNHHSRSREIINGRDNEFKELLSNFYSDLIPNRFLDLLGEVAYSHGVDFSFLLTNMEYEANGLSGDKIHPRFIAALLRLGDILDVDDKRFNQVTEKVLDYKLPKVSEEHRIKHASVKHLLIGPDSIEVIVDCPTDGVYRTARQWFDWVEDEVRNQSREWAIIAPKDLTGLPPTISKGKIKVLFDGSEKDSELLNIKFNIKSEKALELFEGGGIYDVPGYVFLREIVQNAIDASKIQMWRDIVSGRHNYILCKEYKISLNSSTKEIIEKIVYQTDLPLQILAVYQITLFVRMAVDNSSIEVEIIDNGCGISKSDLLRMTEKVGESKYKEKEFANFIKTMPTWLKPTGAFGLGLQSVFFVTDTFTIETKTEFEDPKKIIFNSPIYGSYSYVKKEIPEMGRGTKLKLLINRDRFQELFSDGFSFSILKKYDYFTSEEDIYLYKIEEFLLNELGKINLLNISISDRKVKQSFYSIAGFEDKIIQPLEMITLGSDLRVELYDFDNGFQFVVCINDNRIGSEIRINIVNKFELNSNLDSFDSSITRFYIRDIPINDSSRSYFRTTYLNIEWNLQSPESDKILNIARSKLIKKVKSRITNLFLYDYLPKIVESMFTLLSNKKNKEQLVQKYGLEKVDISLFHLILACKNNDIAIEDFSSIGNTLIPEEFALDGNFKKLQLKKALKGDNILFIEIVKNSSRSRLSKEEFDQIKSSNRLKKFVSENNVQIILFAGNRFYYSLRKDYVITKKVHINDLPFCDFWLFKKGVVSKKGIDCDKESFYKILKKMISNSENRNFILPINPYADILAINNNILSGFEDFPYLSKYSIISPFNLPKDYENLKNELKDVIKFGDRVKIVEILREFYVFKIINKKIINWIISNTCNSKTPTENEILNTYSELIADLLLLP